MVLDMHRLAAIDIAGPLVKESCSIQLPIHAAIRSVG